MSRLLNATIGEYRLVDFIGAGGMGEVYRGVHARLGRMVAVKILTTDSSEPAGAQRFLNEARIQSAMRHPGIATLYDFLEWESRPVIVMEYVDGQTLSDRLQAAGALSALEVASIGASVADTLGYVHSQGIVHRDLKCNNIKIAANGQVKLLDFGIAKAQTDARLTRTGFVVGTFQNLSPEQVMGEEASPASDIWAFGTVLYEMATGRPTFNDLTAPEMFAKIARAEFPSPSLLNPSISRELEAVIVRCLKKKPAERYETADRLRDDLARVKSTLSDRQGAPFVPKPRSIPAWNSTWGIVGGAAAAVVLIGIGVLAMRPTPPPHDPVQPPPIVSIPEKQPVDDGQPTHGTVTLKVQGDMSAEVWENGHSVGNTPYTVTLPLGKRVDVVLKRPGFEEIPVQFEVDKKEYNYTYTMEPLKPSR
jgi:serine/threonine-protein kinase